MIKLMTGSFQPVQLLKLGFLIKCFLHVGIELEFSGKGINEIAIVKTH